MTDLFPSPSDTTNMSVVHALFRESPAGQLLRFVTGNRILKYPEELPGYQVPPQWLDVLNSDRPPSTHHTSGSSASSVHNAAANPSDAEEKDLVSPLPKTETETANTSDRDAEKAAGPTPAGPPSGLDLTRTQSLPIVPQRTKEGIVLVDFYTTDDPANPYNWPRSQKLTSTFILCFYTFVVYASSSIYIPSLPGIIAEYGVGQVEASLGLALYVLVRSCFRPPCPLLVLTWYLSGLRHRTSRLLSLE